jgi:hypothetical protein
MRATIVQRVERAAKIKKGKPLAPRFYKLSRA